MIKIEDSPVNNDLKLDISKNNYKTTNAEITSGHSAIDIWNAMADIDPSVPRFNPVTTADYASYTNSGGIQYSIYYGGKSNPNGWNIQAKYPLQNGRYRTFLKVRSD